jgi:hypothetical protein
MNRCPDGVPIRDQETPVCDKLEIHLSVIRIPRRP